MVDMPIKSPVAKGKWILVQKVFGHQDEHTYKTWVVFEYG